MNILIMVITLTGVVLNIKKRWEGFCLWMVSNVYWCVYTAIRAEYVQSIIFGVYFFMSIYGAFKWRRPVKEAPGYVELVKGSPLEFQRLSYQGSIKDFEIIERLKTRLRAADIAIEIMGKGIEQKAKIVRLVEPFCRRIVAIRDIKPSESVKVKWLFARAKAILDEIND